MVRIFSKGGQDELVDVMREANNGHSPVTFGDCFIDAEGKEQPIET